MKTECRNYHVTFDHTHDPALLIIPNDLDFSLGFEEQNFKERVENGRIGIIQHPACPTATDYRHYQFQRAKVLNRELGGLYCRMILKEFQPLSPSFNFQTPKPWHGAPLAMIQRVFTALGSIRVHKMSSEVYESLSKLRFIYLRSRPEPLIPGSLSDPLPELSTGCSSSAGHHSYQGYSERHLEVPLPEANNAGQKCSGDATYDHGLRT